MAVDHILIQAIGGLEAPGTVAVHPQGSARQRDIGVQVIFVGTHQDLGTACSIGTVTAAPGAVVGRSLDYAGPDIRQ